MKRSAGILVYKKEQNKIKILLCHQGGSYWEGTHLHSWGIPKGELNEKEKVIDAAVREFKEETNLDIKKDNNLKYLYSKKVSNNKLVIIFMKEEGFDLINCRSNTFNLEWPKGSNIIKEYPENDKYEWINLEDAYKLIFKQQIVFLDKLKSKIDINQ